MPTSIPLPLRVLSRTPPLLRLFSRFMAIGIRNEHVKAVLRPDAARFRSSATTPDSHVHT
jgi:hypothetical protein